MQQVRAGGIAKMVLGPETGKDVELRRAEIDHGGVEARGLEHAVDEAADTARPGNQDMAVAGHLVGLAVVATGVTGGDDAVVEDEERGRQQH